MAVASCHLVCLQKTHDAVQLPDGETIVIGRSPDTKITDPRCSRKQLELTADWKCKTVTVKQMGQNPSAVDGKVIGQNCTASLGIDSTLFILSGLYPHKILFQPKQHVTTEKETTNTREINSPLEHKEKKKISSSCSDSSNKQAHSSGKNDGKDAHRHNSDNDKNIHKIYSKTKSKSDKRSSDSYERSKHSAAKRSSTGSDEQPSRKKVRIENYVHHNDIGIISSNKSNITSKHHSSKDEHKLNSAKGHSGESSKLETTNYTINGKNNEMELDEESHLAQVQEKLNKLKQDALLDSGKQAKGEENVASKSSQQKLKTSQGSTASSSSSSTSVSSVVDKKTHELSPFGSSASSKKELSTPPAAFENSARVDQDVNHCVVTSKGVKARNKIAGFDLDGTIIVTKSGKTFPENYEDWKIYLPEIFGKLKHLHSNRYKIVFFTNQLGVAKGKIKLEKLIIKIENIIAKLQVPVQVFIATHEGRYRKPMTGLWEKLEHCYNDGIGIDLKSSIYVGDAAGRLDNWAPKRKKDFSCSDRLFALNIGIPFQTPEEFFQNQKAVTLFKMPDFDPKKLDPGAKLLLGDSKLTSISKEVIVLVGFPACGKSHFATNLLAPKGYTVINRDTLGSWQKCVKLAQEALVNSSVVIDNTNLSREERARYIECAKKAGVTSRCFVFTTNVEHCRHNEKFRQMTSKSHQKINEMIFNQIKKKYSEPSTAEGFTEIVNVNFVPRFSSREKETDYRKFLLEK